MNSARVLMMYCLWRLFFSPSNIISSNLTRSTTTTSHSVCIVASLMLSLLILAVDPGSSDRDSVPSKIYSSLPVPQHTFSGLLFSKYEFHFHSLSSFWNDFKEFCWGETVIYLLVRWGILGSILTVWSCSCQLTTRIKCVLWHGIEIDASSSIQKADDPVLWQVLYFIT